MNFCCEQNTSSQGDFQQSLVGYYYKLTREWILNGELSLRQLAESKGPSAGVLLVVSTNLYFFPEISFLSLRILLTSILSCCKDYENPASVFVLEKNTEMSCSHRSASAFAAT